MGDKSRWQNWGDHPVIVVVVAITTVVSCIVAIISLLVQIGLAPPVAPVTETISVSETETPSEAPPAQYILSPDPISKLEVGSTWTSPKDGAVMMFVPAGEFTMGNTTEKALADCQKFRSDCQLSWFEDEQPPHQVYLKSFWIDLTEVTNARYAKCVDDGICNLPSEITNYNNPYYSDHPVVYVSWDDASTYCDWRGDATRLPTEGEWEKSASWDDINKQKNLYPWGDAFDCTFANAWDTEGICVGNTTKVGSYPSGSSFYSLLDMAGNVLEGCTKSL